MRTKTIFATLAAVAAFSGITAFSIQKQTPKVSTLTTANVEALTDDENATGFKESTTKQYESDIHYDYNPNTGKVIKYYLLYTDVICEGKGHIECEASSEVEAITEEFNV